MAKRAQVLEWLFNAGAENDRSEWLRLWATHRISRAVADERWAAGRRVGEGIAARDAVKENA